jgi:hypothetical protein
VTEPGTATSGDWAEEVAAWQAEESACTACGAALVRDPHLIGSWLARDGDGATGLCAASGNGHHEAGRGTGDDR